MHTLALEALESKPLGDALSKHCRTDLCVPVEGDVASLVDATRLWFADVVQEGSPADFQARDRLLHDLLGVLPHVFVPPLVVTKAHHRGDLGNPYVQASNRLDSIEPRLGVLRGQHAIHVFPETPREAPRATRPQPVAPAPLKEGLLQRRRPPPT